METNKRTKKGNGLIGISSRWETVIDYGIVNEEAWERVEELRIGERIESLEISIEEMNHEEMGNGRAKEEQIKVTIRI
jgi:hypothetical protein